jgi:hypothetical protein
MPRKKAPTSVVGGGYRTANGVNPMSTPTSCFTHANPMPKKKTPTDRPPRKSMGARMVALSLSLGSGSTLPLRKIPQGGGGWKKRKPPSNQVRLADGGTIWGMVLGEHHTHHIGSQMQTRCQEKKYPHRPYADGGVSMKEVLLSESEVLYSTVLTPRINSCKPDAKKKKPPTDQSSSQGQ